MEKPQERSGSNLYPVSMEIEFDALKVSLDVPEGVWNPTPHGIHLGNMLMKMDFNNEHVLELGTGCGIHAILLAKRGTAKLTLTEIEKEINDNALYNLAKNDIGISCETLVADWTQIPDASHGPDGGPYDTVVTNPPFGKSGKRYRRYFIDTLILDAHKLVKRGGRLVFIQSSMADIPRTIRLMEECGMKVRIVGETEGPFRKYYFEDPAYLKEMASIPGAYSVRDGIHYERLMAFEATLP